MNRIIFASLALLPLFGFMLCANSNNEKNLIDQKVGIYQDLQEKQFPLGKIEKFEVDFDQVPLKRLKKIKIYKNLIYLLDWEREKIFVIDKNGNFVRSIGGHGLGPGDLQKPEDFFISKDERIFVLNAQTRRIESFAINGEKLESIRLKLDLESSFPSAILFDDNTFYIGSSLNELISTYDCKGKLISTVLKRKVPLEFPGRHCVFDAKLAFMPKGKKILIFDDFLGIFCIVNRDGTSPVSFSNYMEKQQNYVEKTKEAVRKTEPTTKAYIGSLVFSLWSDYCLDESGNIYTVPLVEHTNDYHQLVAFSSSGTFLYRKALIHEYFFHQNIIALDCDREMFIFVTANFDFIKFKWRKLK